MCSANDEAKLGDAMLDLLDKASKVTCNFQLSVLVERNLKQVSLTLFGNLQ